MNAPDPVSPDMAPAEWLQADPVPAARASRLLWLAAGTALAAAGLSFALKRRAAVKKPQRIVVGSAPPELIAIPWHSAADLARAKQTSSVGGWLARAWRLILRRHDPVHGPVPANQTAEATPSQDRACRHD